MASPSSSTNEVITTESLSSPCPSTTEIDDIWTVMQKCALCEKQINCSSEPMLLSCCHSACKICVDDELAAEHESAHTRDHLQKDKSNATCKICNEKFSPSECIENIFQLHHLKVKQRNESICEEKSIEKRCGSCDADKRAYIKCNTCDFICYDCFESHIKMKIFKDHSFDDSTIIESESRVDSDLTEKHLLCSKHNGELSLYCENCKIPICIKCLVDDHKNHKYDDKLEPALNQFRIDTKETLKKIGQKREFIETALTSIEQMEQQINDQENKVIDDIKEIAKKLQEKISELANARLDYVHATCGKKKSECRENLTQLKQFKGSLTHLEKFVRVVMFGQKVPVAVMKGRKLLEQQLNYLLKKPCNQPNFVTPFIIRMEDTLDQDNVRSSMPQMVEYMFNACCKIKTSDDKEEKEDDDDRTGQKGSDSPIVISIPSPPPLQKTTVPSSAPSSVSSSKGHQVLGVIRGTEQHNAYAPSQSAYENPRQHTQYTSAQYPMPHQSNSNTQMSTTRVHNPMLGHSGHSGDTSCISTHPLDRIHNMQYSMQRSNMTNVSQTGIVPPYSQPAQVNINYQNSTRQQPSPIRVQNSCRMESNAMIGNPQVAVNVAQHMSRQRPIQPHQPQYAFNSSSGGTYYRAANLQNIQPQNQFALLTALSAPSAQIIIPQPSSNLNHMTSTNYMQTYRLSGGSLIPQSSATTQTINTRVMSGSMASNASAMNNMHFTRPNSPITIAQLPTNATVNPPNRQMPQQMIQQKIQSIRSPLATQLQTPQLISNNVLSSRALLDQQLQSVNDQQQLREFEKIQQMVTQRANTPQQSTVNVQINEQRRISNDTVTISPVIQPQRTTVATAPSVATPVTIIPRSPPVTAPSPVSSIASSASTVSLNINDNAKLSQLTDLTVTKVLTDNGNKPSLNENQSSVTIEKHPVSSKDNAVNGKDKVSDAPPKVTDVSEELKESEETAITRKIATITPLVPNSEDQELDSDDGEETDENDDWCSVCHDGGELLCCEKCPKAFHIECHVPQLSKVPLNEWSCTFCKDISKIGIESQRKKNKSFISLNERQQTICERILLELMCHEKSIKLHHYVRFAPKQNGTQTSSKSTIDFATIRKKISEQSSDKYEDESEFLEDINRVFNLYASNKNGDDSFYNDGHEVYNQYVRLVTEYLPDFKNIANDNSIEENMKPQSKKCKLN